MKTTRIFFYVRTNDDENVCAHARISRIHADTGKVASLIIIKKKKKKDASFN